MTNAPGDDDRPAPPHQPGDPDSDDHNGGGGPDRGLRAGSLRRRVTITSVAVLTVAMIAVVVISDVVFAARARGELDRLVTARAVLAEQLAAANVPAPRIARRAAAGGGLAVRLTTPDGRVYGDPDLPGRDPRPSRVPPPRPPGQHRQDGPELTTRALAGGATITLVADRAETTAAQSRLRRTLGIVALGAVVIAGLALWATTRPALAPLEAMTRTARQITRGDRGRRLAPQRPDTELGRLAAAFDEMLDALEGAEHTARASEASTRRFVADAAHELRTPLAGISAAAEASARPGLSESERDQLTALLVREAHRAADLAADLLTLARLDAGITAAAEPVELRTLTDDAVEAMTMLSPTPTWRVEGGPATVTGDPTALRRALTNLLANAARHSPPDGVVTISIHTDPATATLRVADQGPGVDPTDRDRIFERMTRLDPARSAEAGGAGLGLPIARTAARAHGGDLACVDPGPDEHGAVFILTLPQRPQP